jgi:hypothetical protein
MEDMDKAFTAVNAEGDVIGKVCLGIVLYYQGSHTREKREVILRIFDHYAALVGENSFHWTGSLSGNRWIRLKNGIHSYATPRDWLPDEKDAPWSFGWHGGEREEDASCIAIEALGHRSADQASGDLDWIYCHFPVDLFTDKDVRLKEVALQWSSWLQPDRGYAGLWFADRAGTWMDSKRLRFQLARRFPGLIINHFIGEGLWLHNAIKGVDWLTILSGRWLEKLGGLQAVKEQMRPLPVLEYPGGAVLQAGPCPQIGDNEAGVDLPDYSRVAAIIEPIRFKGEWCLDAGSEFFNVETTRTWLTRFSPQPK